MSKLDSLASLGALFGIEPSKDDSAEQNIKEENFKSLDLRIWIKKIKGNKQISVIEGFDEDEDLSELSKEIKMHCGTGGSVKDNTIIIQGNHREKIKDFLIKKGAKVKLAGG